MPDVIEHSTRQAQAEAVAAEMAAALDAAIREKGAALLACSGGSTPAAAYEALSHADIDWSKISVVLVDERWVDEDHEKSNAAFLRRTLLKNRAAAAHFVPLKTAGDSPALGLDAVLSALAALPFPPDAALMGMGTDGHTASWFPGADGLDAALNGPERAAAIAGASGAAASGQDQRITLTASALDGAGWMGLMIAGDDKRQALEEALTDGPVAEMPVRAILPRPGLRIHWAA